MRATTAITSVWRAYALAFGLGLAFLDMAHAQSSGTSRPPQIAPAQIVQGLLPPVPDNSFVCRAKPGGWCDLRDWRGFGEASAN